MTSDDADREVPRSDGMAGGDVAPGSHQPPRAPALKRLLAELKRRHVFRVAAVYGVVGFAVIEVAQAIFPHVGLSETAVTLVVWLVLLGFPVALVLAWAFETTPGGGIHRTARAEPVVLDAIAAQPVGRRWPSGLAGAAGGALMVVAAWLALGDLGEATARLGFTAGEERAVFRASEDADPGVAVLPFRFTGTDSTVFHAGMVDLLSFNLDGLPGLRKIEPATMMVAWRELEDDAVPDSALAHEVARGTGARYVIAGSAVQPDPAGHIRLTARVYDSEVRSFRGSARVDGPADSVIQLVDDLTVEILREGLLPSDGALPAVNLGRVTTTSLPAMKAYLRGEEAWRRGQLNEAAPHFREAIELDSTFARAYYRLGRVYTWGRQWSLGNPLLARAAELADALPERDRKLIEYGRDHLAHVEELQAYTRTYPDDPEGWALLGDALMHRQGFTRPEHYRRALEQALSIAPHYFEGYGHLIDDALAHRDRNRLEKLVAARDSLTDADAGCADAGLLYDLWWGDPIARVAAEDSMSARSVWGTCYAFDKMVSERQMRSFEHELFADDAVTPFGLLLMMTYRLYHGQPSRADSILDAVSADPVHRGVVAADRIIMRLVRYTGTLDTDAAVEALRQYEMVPWEAPESWAGFVVNHFWLGALALEQERRADFRAATTTLDSIAGEVAERSPASADSTAAFADALREFERITAGEFDRLDEFEAAAAKLRFVSVVSEYPVSYLRYAIGRLLLDAGRLEQAERYFISLNPFSMAFFVPAQFYLGQTYEQLGRPDEARERYRIFVEWWENADPHLQPWRDEAIEALRRLAPDS